MFAVSIQTPAGNEVIVDILLFEGDIVVPLFVPVIT